MLTICIAELPTSARYKVRHKSHRLIQLRSRCLTVYNVGYLLWKLLLYFHTVTSCFPERKKLETANDETMQGHEKVVISRI